MSKPFTERPCCGKCYESPSVGNIHKQMPENKIEAFKTLPRCKEDNDRMCWWGIYGHKECFMKDNK